MSSSTRAAPQALTTPFVLPQSCANQFITTSFASRSTYVTVVASCPADPRFSACQPPGWDSGGEGSSFQFSPAVCPSGWTAYNLGGTVSWVRHGASMNLITSKTFSTAYCCSSGFTYSHYHDLLIDGFSRTPLACFANTTDTAAPTATASPAGSPHRLRVHNAWHISWDASDISSLSPTPPPFAPCTTSPVIRSWVPGATVEPNAFFVPGGACEWNDGTSRWSKGETIGMWFLMVGVPIIGLAILATCLGCWCRRRRRRVRDGRETGTSLWRLESRQSDMAKADGNGIRTDGGPRPAHE
ncbi:hypothetical protein N657DRAFT_161697 [Parathielavia appendiculata]|uniref:Uncharacterized protein n=1 Tax=Parathielavia appendiculata TaxID=2587402 RepID=A0AAN6Z0G1_9PEZI|nr:hypothetical protein N657DRAFT_161697 [Parathielavia appendiculata]